MPPEGSQPAAEALWLAHGGQGQHCTLKISLPGTQNERNTSDTRGHSTLGKKVIPSSPQERRDLITQSPRVGGCQHQHRAFPRRPQAWALTTQGSGALQLTQQTSLQPPTLPPVTTLGQHRSRPQDRRESRPDLVTPQSRYAGSPGSGPTAGPEHLGSPLYTLPHFLSLLFPGELQRGNLFKYRKLDLDIKIFKFRE